MPTSTPCRLTDLGILNEEIVGGFYVAMPSDIDDLF